MEEQVEVKKVEDVEKEDVEKVVKIGRPYTHTLGNFVIVGMSCFSAGLITGLFLRYKCANS